MRRSKFSDDEIQHLLDDAESGVPIEEICRASHVSLRTFYRWRRRLGGLTAPAVEKLKQLEKENHQLRALVQELSEAKGASPRVADTVGRSKLLGVGSEASPSGPVSLSNRSTAMLAGRFAASRVLF